MTTQRTITELISKNPMLIEIARVRRRLLTFTGNSAVGGVLLALIGICYLGFVTLVITFRASIDPIDLVMVQSVLFILLAPTLLHSSIAGERERRSWDLLLAAPITKSQIVVGKFLGALSAIGIGTAFFVFPIGVTAIANSHTNFWDLGLAEAVCLSFTVLVCSITLFFSARVKTSFMALGATLGVLGVGLVVLPALMAALWSGTGTMANYYNDTLMYLHPMFVFSRILMAANETAGMVRMVPNAMFGIPQVLVYLGLSAVIVGWAINTLNFAENEVKFLPKAKS
jgi:ABC-type transport system involved in multi-copper enzyme maturation permease subunit